MNYKQYRCVLATCLLVNSAWPSLVGRRNEKTTVASTVGKLSGDEVQVANRHERNHWVVRGSGRTPKIWTDPQHFT